jgi:hypothetical protein
MLFPMKPFELRLANALFSRALECSCPESIPRSGVSGAKVKCFTIRVDKFGAPYLFVKGLSGGMLSCLEWTGSRFEKPVEIPLNEIESSDVSITHFYGCSVVEYNGVIDFAIGRTFFFPYFKIHIVRAIKAVDQYFFNKKKLMTKQRIDLLRFLVQRQLDGKRISSSVDLMTELYSIKWILHPDKDDQLNRVRFYLNSLVDTGEMRRKNDEYQLTGEALKVIEVYEEQERKHTENVKGQRKMLWLTLAIVLLTAAQAGLFKLPNVIDLSDSKIGHNPFGQETLSGKAVRCP